MKNNKIICPFCNKKLKNHVDDNRELNAYFKLYVPKAIQLPQIDKFLRCDSYNKKHSHCVDYWDEGTYRFILAQYKFKKLQYEFLAENEDGEGTFRIIDHSTNNDLIKIKIDPFEFKDGAKILTSLYDRYQNLIAFT